MAPRRSLAAYLRNLFNRLGASPASELVGDDEPVSRFIVDSRHFKPDRVLPKAFEPKLDDERQRSETSVFRTMGIDASDIWKLAERHVEPTRGKPVLARAELHVRDAALESLSVVGDEPPVRHAVIVGWPEGDDEKSRRKLIGQELASRARLHHRRETSTSS